MQAPLYTLQLDRGCSRIRAEARGEVAACAALPSAVGLTGCVADLSPALARDAHRDAVPRRGEERGVDPLVCVLLLLAVAAPDGRSRRRLVAVVMQKPARPAAGAPAAAAASTAAPSARPAGRWQARWRQHNVCVCRTALKRQKDRVSKPQHRVVAPWRVHPPSRLHICYVKVLVDLETVLSVAGSKSANRRKCRAAGLCSAALLGCRSGALRRVSICRICTSQSTCSTAACLVICLASSDRPSSIAG